MTDRYKWSSGIQSSMQDMQGDVLSPSEIPQRLNEQARRINELERIMQLAHIHSRTHTPGYCTVRQSDIDSMGRMIFPLDDEVKGDE